MRNLEDFTRDDFDDPGRRLALMVAIDNAPDPGAALDEVAARLGDDVESAYEAHRTPHAVTLRDWNMTADGSRVRVRDYENITTFLARERVGVFFDTFENDYFIAYGGKVVPYTDRVADKLRNVCQSAHGWLPDATAFHDAIKVLAARDERDSLRDYLEGLPPWDGTPRLDTFFATYYGADADDEVARAAGRLMMLGLIWRALVPGCQYDYMVILESEQGVKKSTGLAALMPNPDWFTDAVHLGATSKETLELTGGIWLAEVAELANPSKRDVESIKAQITRKRDKARRAYARTSETVPRRFVMVGTTNAQSYLLDSFNRRFIPVRVTAVDRAAIARDRAQLFAEALAAYRAGELPMLPDGLMLTDHQADRRIQNPLETFVADRLAPDAWGYLDGAKLVELFREKQDMKYEAAHRLVYGDSLAALGFVRHRFAPGATGDEAEAPPRVRCLVRVPPGWRLPSQRSGYATAPDGRKVMVPEIDLDPPPKRHEERARTAPPSPTPVFEYDESRPAETAAAARAHAAWFKSEGE